LTALLGFTACLFMYLTCRLYVGEEAASKTTFLFGSGTMLLTYSQFFYPDILCAALVMASFHYLLRWSRHGLGRDLAFAGLMAGFMPISKPSLIILPLAASSLLLLRGVRPSLIFAAAFSITGISFLLYNYACFSSPLASGYSSMLMSSGGVLKVVDLTAREYWSNSVPMTAPATFLVFALANPLVLLSLWGAYRVRRLEGLVALAPLPLLILLYAGNYNPLGLVSWGDRYLLPALPLLSLPFALAYESKRLPESAIIPVYCASLTLSLLALDPNVWVAFSNLTIISHWNIWL
jgi:hypothetical protein